MQEMSVYKRQIIYTIFILTILFITINIFTIKTDKGKDQKFERNQFKTQVCQMINELYDTVPSFENYTFPELFKIAENSSNIDGFQALIILWQKHGGLYCNILWSKSTNRMMRTLQLLCCFTFFNEEVDFFPNYEYWIKMYDTKEMNERMEEYYFVKNNKLIMSNIMRSIMLIHYKQYFYPDEIPKSPGQLKYNCDNIKFKEAVPIAEYTN